MKYTKRLIEDFCVARLSNDDYVEFDGSKRSGMPGAAHYIHFSDDHSAQACKVSMTYVQREDDGGEFWGLYSPEGVERLTSYFQSLENGKPYHERGCLPYKGSKEAAMLTWKSKVDTMLSSRSEVQEFELTFNTKTGPQGVVPSWSDEVINVTLGRYYANPKPSHTADALLMSDITEFGINLAADFVEKWGIVTPRGLSEVMDIVQAKGMDTRTGAPLYDKKDSPEACRRALSEAKFILENITRYKDQFDERGEYIPGLRMMKQGVRVIFMEPFADTLIAGTFTGPLTDYLRGTGLPEFLGWSDKFTVAGKAFNQFRKEHSTLWPKVFHFMSDFSKMDTTVRGDQVEVVLQFCFVLFGITDPTSPLAYQLRWSIENLTKAPLRVNDKWVLVSEDHGAFSGASWIQMAEQLLQLILSRYFLSRTREVLAGRKQLTVGKPLSDIISFIRLLGDDAAWSLMITNSLNTRNPAEITFIMSDVIVSSDEHLGAGKAKFKLRDDGGYHVAYSGTLAEVWTAFCAKVGLVCSLEKQRMSFDSADFCKHLTRTRSRAHLIADDMDPTKTESYRLEAIYSVVLAFNSTVYPERLASHWDLERDYGRIIQIIDGCCDHPLFTHLIEYVAKGHSTDLYRRGARYLPMMTLEEFDGVIFRLQRVIDGVQPRDYTWYTADGYQKIVYKHSPTVKYLRKSLEDWHTRNPSISKPAIPADIDLIAQLLSDLD